MTENPIIIYIERERIIKGCPDPIQVKLPFIKMPFCCSEVQINGPSKIVYSPDKDTHPRAWVETNSEVVFKH